MVRISKLIVTLSSAIFLWASLAQAKPANTGDEYDYLLGLSFDELAKEPVLSSGLFATDWSQAPGIYYSISKTNFDKFGFRSIGEYLSRVVPGIHTGLHGNQGTLLGVRGIMVDTNAKTLLLRDNINMNTRNLVGINGSKLSTPLLGDLDRIEVSLGPGALQHGSGAINGFINMISATGKTKPGFNANIGYGSGRSKLAEASYGHVVSDKLNIFFYAGYSQADGVDPYYSVPTDQWAGLNGVNGTPSSQFLDNAKIGKTDDDFRLSFRGIFGKQNGLFHLDLKTMVARTTNVDPVLGEYLGPNALWSEEIRLTAEARRGRYSPFYTQYDEEFLFSPELIFKFNPNNEVKVIPFLVDHRSGNEFSDELNDWVNELNVALTPKDDCVLYHCADDYPNYGNEQHLGVTLIHNYSGIENHQLGWGAEAKEAKFHYFPVEWQTFSLFGEDTVSWRHFTFSLGLRYDKIFHEDSWVSWQPASALYDVGPYNAPPDEDALTKRMAVSYLIKTDQAVKFSYQEGFRFADKHPQHWAIARASQAGNSSYSIEPEKSKSFELNYSALGLYKSKVNMTATAFYNIYEKTHGWVHDQFGFGNSAKDIKAFGAEFNFEYHPLADLELGLSYSFARPENSYETQIKIANQDDTWTRYPEHMFKFHFGYQLGNLFFGGAGAFESPRYNKQLTDAAIVDLYNDWDLIVDLVSSYRFNKYCKLTLSAKELLTKHYNQNTAYFQGERPLDNPRAADPQYYLSLDFAY